MNAFCLRCGARHGEEAPCACSPYRAVPEGPRLGMCPSCGQPLVDEVYADTPASECVACGGIFLDGVVLDRVIEAKEQRISLAISLPVRKYERNLNVRYVPCPRCAVQMNRKVFGRSSGVVVDMCKEHGVWFDAGELGAVLAFIESGGLERAKRAEEREASDRARAEKTKRAAEAAMFMPSTSEGRVDVASELFDTLLEWWKHS